MAGSRGIRGRPGALIVATALAAAIAGESLAQTPAVPSLPPAGKSASASSGAAVVTFPTGSDTFYSGGDGSAAPCCKVGLGLFDTMTESLFGKPDPNCWRPLTLSTLFTEGWNDAWVPSPNGSARPRQGWINAADGNIYRLNFVTFAQGFNDAPKGTAYQGAYTLLTPLNRRFEIITNVPFVLRNNVDSGLPAIDPSGQPTTATTGHSGFGDISVTSRVLLHETKDFSLTADFTTSYPTGTQPLAGNTYKFTPSIAFWDNVAGGVVIRGGIGVQMPKDGSGDEMISQLAIGQTITDHDVPLLGDFTYYVSAVANTPLTNTDLTRVTLTPGIRTHLGCDWYLLAGMPIPVTKERVADLGLVCWFMKAW